MNYTICTDRNNQILCWGSMSMCDNYINQFYGLNEKGINYHEYSNSEYYSSFYEDYEVHYINGTNVYLTLGEIKMVREGCQDETRGIKYIQSELEHLSTLTSIYNNSIIEELLYMKDFMKEIFNIHAKYNMDNAFKNLDIDALHSSYQIERENKGLPIVFIK